MSSDRIPITSLLFIYWALKFHHSVHSTDVQFHLSRSSSPLQLFPVLNNAFYGWWIRRVLHCHFQLLVRVNTTATVLHITRQQLLERWTDQWQYTLSNGRNRLPPLISSTWQTASISYQATTYSWLVSSFQTAVVWNRRLRSKQSKPFCYKYQFQLDAIILLCHLLHPLWDQLAPPPVASFVGFYGEHTHTYNIAWKDRWSSRQFLPFLSIFSPCMSDFLLFPNKTVI